MNILDEEFRKSFVSDITKPTKAAETQNISDDVEKAFNAVVARVYHRNMHGKFVPKTIAGVPKQYTKDPTKVAPDADSE